jgi:hypothetical protein
MTDLVQRLREWGESGRSVSHLLKLSADRIEQLEKVLTEWSDKTEWVQKTCDWQELGMHRADALKHRIEQLERENAELRRDAERYRWLKNMFGWHILRDYLVDVDATNNLDAVLDKAMKEQT